MAMQEYVYLFTEGPGQGGLRIPVIDIGDLGTLDDDLKTGVSCGNLITGNTLDLETGESTWYGLLPIQINSGTIQSQLPSSREDEDPFFALPNYTPILYDPNLATNIRKVYTPPTGDDPPLYPQDIGTRWQDKYYTLQTYTDGGITYNYMYNLDTYHAYDPEDPDPYVVPVDLYEFTDNTPLTRVLWTGENRYFGYSHLWKITHYSGVSGNYLDEYLRIFCSAGNSFNGYDFFTPTEYIETESTIIHSGIFDKTSIESYWEYFEHASSKSYSQGSIITDKKSEISAIFVKFTVSFNEDVQEELPAAWPEDRKQGDTFIALLTFARDRDTGEIKTITKGAALSSNWFEVDANDRDDDEGEDEPETGMGIRPPRVNQYPGNNIGTQFDLGLTHASPGSTGIKLFYCNNIASINAYLNRYISTHVPTFDDPLSDMVHLFGAAASEAIFNNTYGSILDIYKLPFLPDGTRTSSNQFNICGEVIEGESGITLPNLYYGWNQQKILNCGTIQLPEIYDLGWLNYAPYIKATIAIPFCGVFEIPINTFMGGSIALQYSVDCLTGACTAYVFGVDRDRHSTLIGTFAGDMKLPVPLGITAANTSIIGQALRGGVSGLGKALTFGNSAMGGRNSQPFFNTSAGTPNTYTYGNQAFQSPTSVRTGVNTSAGNSWMVAGMGLQMIADAGQNASEIRGAQVELSSVVGQIGGCSGWNNFPIPFIRLDCPVIKEPSAYKRMVGRPANITVRIGDIPQNTFCKAKGFIPDISRATANEAIEIRRILTTGFYT